MGIQAPRRVVRLYLLSDNILDRFCAMLRASFNGLWLGLLDSNTLNEIDRHYYDHQAMYCDEAYNRRGLWKWEREMIERFFALGSRVCVAGAGGGREVLALRELGYAADGFECNPQLVAFANQLLESDAASPSVRLAPRDECPRNLDMYDGIVVGWGAYMHIQGRAQRIAFLRQLRRHLRPGSPILLSFFARSEGSPGFRLTAAIGNILRRALGRELLEVGDALDTNYVHFCSREDVAYELRASGFQPAYYATTSYGHAVGIAMGNSAPELAAAVPAMAAQLATD